MDDPLRHSLDALFAEATPPANAAALLDDVAERLRNGETLLPVADNVGA